MITIAEVIEQAAQIADEFYPPGKISAGHAIRALAAQYEGCIVAEGSPQHGRSVGTPLYRAREWLPKAYRDGDKGDDPKFTKYNMEVAFAAGAAAEREACAKVCYDADKSTHPTDLGDAIRARSEK